MIRTNSRGILDPYAKASFGREGPGLLIHSLNEKLQKKLQSPEIGIC